MIDSLSVGHSTECYVLMEPGMNFHPRDDFCQNEYSWGTEILGDEVFHPLVDEDP